MPAAQDGKLPGITNKNGSRLVSRRALFRDLEGRVCTLVQSWAALQVGEITARLYNTRLLSQLQAAEHDNAKGSSGHQCYGLWKEVDVMLRACRVCDRSEVSLPGRPSGPCVSVGGLTD